MCQWLEGDDSQCLAAIRLLTVCICREEHSDVMAATHATVLAGVPPTQIINFRTWDVLL